MMIVGIDHGGIRRAREYLPVEDERNPFARRPMGRQVRRVRDARGDPVHRAHVSGGAAGLGAGDRGILIRCNRRAAGGSERPGIFGRLLLESPSLYVGQRLLLRKARRAPRWPARVYLGVGTAETSKPDTNLETVDNVRALESILRDAGLGPKRLKVVVQDGAYYSEHAWAARFPEALTYLFRNP